MSALATVRAVEPGDYASIAQFLVRFRQRERSPEFWLRRMRHWWDQNPDWSRAMPRGWVIDHEGATVGFIGVIPRAVDTSAGAAVSSNTTTWWVLPEYRNHSLTMLTRAVAPAVPVHINTTPGDAVVPLLKALRFVPFPGGGRDRESVLILDPLALAVELASRRVPAIAAVPASVYRTLGAPARAGLALFRRVRGPRMSLACEVMNHAGPEFDRLWEARRPGTLTAVRTEARLNWYVFGSPDRPKALIACFSGGALVGFVILGDREHPKLRLLDCIDFYVVEDDPRIVESLLAAAGEHARAVGAAFVGFRHYSAFLASCFRALGLIERATESGRELIRAHAEISLEPSAVYLTQLHGDRWL
jgi:hypothetical protein